MQSRKPRETLLQKQARLAKELANVTADINADVEKKRAHEAKVREENFKKLAPLRDKILGLCEEYSELSTQLGFNTKVTAFVSDRWFNDVKYITDPFDHEYDPNRGIWYSSSLSC